MSRAMECFRPRGAGFELWRGQAARADDRLHRVRMRIEQSNRTDGAREADFLDLKAQRLQIKEIAQHLGFPQDSGKCVIGKRPRKLKIIEEATGNRQHAIAGAEVQGGSSLSR